VEWQRYGENPTVIAFFYEKFESLYRTRWEDFLRMVGGVANIASTGAAQYLYRFQARQTNQNYPQKTRENINRKLQQEIANLKRLNFRRSR
jgi:hypothetical protein